MNIKIVSKITKLSSSTIRYYEKQHIIPKIKRDTNGNRMFSQDDIDWLLFAKQMRSAGISIKSLRYYVSLFYQGDSSTKLRVLLLQKERQKLEVQDAQLKKAIDHLDQKISNYQTHMITTENQLRKSAFF